MKLIQVKRLGPTDTKGTRFSVTMGNGHRMICAYNYELDYDRNVIEAAREYVNKFYADYTGPRPRVVPDVGHLASVDFDVVRLEFVGAENVL